MAGRMRQILLTCVVSLAVFGWATGHSEPAHTAQTDRVDNTVYVESTLRGSTGEIVTDPQYVKGIVTNLDSGQQYAMENYGYPGIDWASLPDGRYTLHMWRDIGPYNSVRSATTWWPGVYSKAAAGVFRLRHDADEACDVYAPPSEGCWGLFWKVQLEENRRLSGHVRSRSAQSLSSSRVTVVRQDDANATFSAVSDDQGRFSFVIPPGRYEVQATNGAASLRMPVTLDGAAQALDLILSEPPQPPISVIAASVSKRASVAWERPVDDGGAPVLSYRATATPGGMSCTSTATLGCTIDGLANNRQYSFTVTATNAVGTSEPSIASNPVTPLDPAPSAPFDVRAVAGDRLARVAWSPPRAGADTVTGYRVISNPAGASCATVDLNCEIGGLQNGVSYTFSVIAASTGGASEPSESSNAVRPAAVPTAPRSVQTVPGSRSVFVRWNAPESDGGAPVSHYTATARPGGRTCTVSAPKRHCAIGKLFNGTEYTVTVTATNSAGVSPRSPGAIAVLLKSKMSPQKDSGSRPRLFATSAKPGELTVRWTSVGSRKVQLTWRAVGHGQQKTARTSPSGNMILRGRPGQRFVVSITARTPEGGRATSRRTFVIPTR